MGRTVAGSGLPAGPVAHRAARVHPVCAPPIDDGCVLEQGGIIRRVGRWPELRGEVGDGWPVVDHGDVHLVPGFVNAHAHLELTDHGTIVFDGSFPAWLEAVSSRSRAMRAEGLAAFSRAATHGARMLAESGAAAIADTTLWGAEADSDALVVRVHEVIALAADGADRPFLASALRLLAEDTAAGRPSAIEPHTPYTAHPAVIRRAYAAALAARRTFAIHLAETLEEVEFLRDGTGRVREYLREMEADPREFRHPDATTPVAHLDRLDTLTRAVLFHGNYIAEEEFALLARKGASVVYCPRSHRHFRHAPHPAAAMLRAGVNVCIGTDGLVSNEGLDMREEIGCTLAHCTALSPEDALLMATLSGARAFGLDGQLGSLAPGLLARFAELPAALWA